MIARIWHGKTRIENYDAYTNFLKRVAIPDYKNTRGFKSLRFLRAVVGNEGHFYLITCWENIEAIKSFAGEDFERPKYYPEDKSFLLELDVKAMHYQVFA
jgi:heme-degrading monooxygenase HmoA